MLGLFLGDGVPIVGWGKDFCSVRGPLTKTAVIWKQKVGKSIKNDHNFFEYSFEQFTFLSTFLSTFFRTFLRTFPFEDFFEYFFEDFFEDFSF